MNTKTLLLIVLIALVATGGYFFATGGGNDPLDQLPGMSDSETPPSIDPTTSPDNQPTEISSQSKQKPTPERVALKHNDAGSDLPQGVEGVVVDPAGKPIAGTPVFLMEASHTNLFRMLKQANQGVIIPPIATGTTDRNGEFALGLRVPDPDKTLEIRVISDRFVESKIPGLLIQPKQWYNAGRIQMQRGMMVAGHVTIEGSTGLPVPNAVVQLKSNTGFPEISPTPGREYGLSAKVDHTGYFRVENAPSGIVTISAVAPGYARIEKVNTAIAESSENIINFELPKGLAIAGVVIDADGAPVANAKVEASAISSKTPATGQTRSDRQGNFSIIGLVEGPYLMSAVAPGYVRKEERPVPAGQTNLELVLESQGGARIRVSGRNGALLRSYTLTLKSYFENQEQYGQTDIPPRQARPDRDGVTLVQGIDPGSYVFQVNAKGYAKSFSAPFSVTIGGDEPLVEVTMNEGGTIEGIVMDRSGKPLPGVTVVTLPNHLDENPFTKMFAGIIPFKVTRTSGKTDAQGAYRFTLLNPGTYQLKFAHADYYDVFKKGHAIQIGQTTTIPTLVMQRGTVISGIVRVDGKPAAQVKVTVSSAHNPDLQMPTNGFNAEAITDNEGQFIFSKRIPPGRYQAMAARQTLENPLLQIADFAKTKQEFTLSTGHAKYQLNIQINSNDN